MANLSRRFIVGSSATILGLALASLGLARPQQGDATRLDSVQQKQKQQIHEGVENGDLNKKQAAKLEKHEKNIQATEARDRANGSMTNAEAKQLKQETKRENSHIKRAEAHNGKPQNH